MPSEQPIPSDVRRAFLIELHQHWALYLVEGVVLIVLGLTAIANSPAQVDEIYAHTLEVLDKETAYGH